MPEAPEVQGLVHYALVVRDVVLSQRWYSTALGAKIPERKPGFPPRMELAGTVIDLFPSGGITPAGLPLGNPAPGSIGQHHAFAINLDDFDKWTAHLTEINQEFRCAAHGTTYMSIYVDDPDGYHLELTVIFSDEAAGHREMEKRGIVPRYMTG